MQIYWKWILPIVICMEISLICPHFLEDIFTNSLGWWTLFLLPREITPFRPLSSDLHCFWWQIAGCSVSLCGRCAFVWLLLPRLSCLGLTELINLWDSSSLKMLKSRFLHIFFCLPLPFGTPVICIWDTWCCFNVSEVLFIFMLKLFSHLPA